MRSTFKYLLVLSCILSPLFSTAFAEPTRCSEHFANGEAPDLINQKLSANTKEICYSAFALKHSGVSRTALYAAEHLTKDRLMQAKGLRRKSTFHSDPFLTLSERAELHHYARSGYDRGHIAPSGDMPSPESQQESFTLANMIPQVPSVNRGVWEGVESTVRKLAKARGDLYIVTGPIYSGNSIQRIGGAVMVPNQTFKAVYDPKRNEAGAYLVDNAEGATVQIISIAKLEKVSGISVFPSVSNQIKSNGMRLPEPKERKRRGRRS